MCVCIESKSTRGHDKKTGVLCPRLLESNFSSEPTCFNLLNNLLWIFSWSPLNVYMFIFWCVHFRCYLLYDRRVLLTYATLTFPVFILFHNWLNILHVFFIDYSIDTRLFFKFSRHKHCSLLSSLSCTHPFPLPPNALFFHIIKANWISMRCYLPNHPWDFQWLLWSSWLSIFRTVIKCWPHKMAGNREHNSEFPQPSFCLFKEKISFFFFLDHWNCLIKPNTTEQHEDWSRLRCEGKKSY